MSTTVREVNYNTLTKYVDPDDLRPGDVFSGRVFNRESTAWIVVAASKGYTYVDWHDPRVIFEVTSPDPVSIDVEVLYKKAMLSFYE